MKFSIKNPCGFKYFTLLLALTWLCGCGSKNAKITSVERPDISKTNDFYVGNKAPLKPLYFIKLPTGSIKAGGWAKKYLELQRDGLTGHLGEISAWLQKDGNAWLSSDGRGEFGWEEVPYWLKGYADLGYLLNDKKMISEAKIWFNSVFEHQQPDGYFGPSTSIKKADMNFGPT